MWGAILSIVLEILKWWFSRGEKRETAKTAARDLQAETAREARIAIERRVEEMSAKEYALNRLLDRLLVERELRLRKDSLRADRRTSDRSGGNRV